MIVTAKPSPSISSLISRERYAFSKFINMSFYPLGRDALLSGLIALGIQKGDSIIIPAYMCNSTIQPLADYGFKLIFIDIDKNLNLPIDKVKKVVIENDAKALLVVHYFGFVQQINKLVDACHTLGVKVVEDSSHSFLSSKFNDSLAFIGDMEIFSMRKSLPVQDGGALRFKDGFVLLDIKKCSAFKNDIRYLMVRFVEKIAIRLGFNIYNATITKKKNNIRNINKSKVLEKRFAACKPSWQLSRYLKNEKYLTTTKLRINRNFNKLSKSIKKLGFRLVVEAVSDNIPQALVFYDEKGGLVDYLRDNGVGAWNWPGVDLPKSVHSNIKKYPNSIHMSKQLVFLPIHQDITKRDIEYMVKILKNG